MRILEFLVRALVASLAVNIVVYVLFRFTSGFDSFLYLLPVSVILGIVWASFTTSVGRKK